jgi:hypothetical protein
MKPTSLNTRILIVAAIGVGAKFRLLGARQAPLAFFFATMGQAIPNGRAARPDVTRRVDRPRSA